MPRPTMGEGPASTAGAGPNNGGGGSNPSGNAGGSANRNGGGNQQQQHQHPRRPEPKGPKFEGRIEGLKGHVYDMTGGYKGQDLFERTGNYHHIYSMKQS